MTIAGSDHPRDVFTAEPTRGTAGSRGALLTLLRGSGIVFAGMGVRAVLLLVTEALVARHLGPSDYGLVTWGLIVINFGAVFSALGLNTAARRFIPLHLQRGDSAAVAACISFILRVTTAVGIAAAALMFAAAPALSEHAGGTARQLPVLQALVFTLPLWNMQKVLLAVASGFKRPWVKVTIEDLLVPLGFLGVALIARSAGWGATGIALGYAGVYGLSAVAAAVALRRQLPSFGSAPMTSGESRRELVRFSWPLIVTESLGKATGMLDLLVIGIVADATSVGTYRSASDLAVTMSLVLMGFGFLYVPLATEYFARSDAEGWREFNARVARWTMLLSFPVFAVLFFRPHAVLGLVYGTQFTGAAHALQILAVAYFVHAMVGFTGANLVVAGKTRLQLVARVAATAVALIGYIVLIPRFGIVGAAYATLGGTITSNGINLAFAMAGLRLHPFTPAYARALPALLVAAVGVSMATGRLAVTDTGALVIFAIGLAAALAALMKLQVIVVAGDWELLGAVLRGRRRSDA